MKALRQFCAASMLTLVLALSTFAGEIETPRTPPPQQATHAGDIETGKAGDIEIPLTVEIALNLIQGVLSLI